MGSKIDVKGLDPQERFKASVRHNFDTRHEFLTRGNRCSSCVLVQACCVCDKLNQLATSLPGYRIAILMNQREQYRSSNTAKVIERVLGGEIYIDGIDEDWQRFQALTDKYKGRCFVLFPSEESVEYTQLDRIDVSDSLIVVVDGTWRQARKLNKKIDPSIPRVRITPTTLSKFLCRRQTRVDRVCTAEALSLLLEDMGKREASENLDTGFSVVVEGFNMQCYNKSHRPSNLLKHPPHLLKPGSNLPPRHPDALIKDI